MKRLLFMLLAAGLALVGFQAACHAITASWDYTKYRVQVYMERGELTIPDEDNIGEAGLIRWLLGTGPNDAKYEVIAEGLLNDDE